MQQTVVVHYRTVISKLTLFNLSETDGIGAKIGKINGIICIYCILRKSFTSIVKQKERMFGKSDLQ